MKDTPEEVQQLQYQIMRNMGTAKRARLGFEMIETGRQISLNSLRQQMTTANELQIQEALLKR